MNNLEVDRDIYVNNMANLDGPIANIIGKFKDHPSIVNINQLGFTSKNFSIQFVSENHVYRVINSRKMLMNTQVFYVMTLTAR